LETVDIQGTAAVIGVPPTVPGDFAIWLDYAGKLLGDSGISAASLTAGGGMMPYHILAGETFTIPVRRQGLSAMAIDVEGLLVVDGMLIEVN
jgi:hypothetical protein